MPLSPKSPLEENPIINRETTDNAPLIAPTFVSIGIQTDAQKVFALKSSL